MSRMALMGESDGLRQERIAHLERLLWAASSGILDNLECSECHQYSVSVWFTHPAEGQYRTWIICGKCRFHLHAINSGIPPHYSEDRVSDCLENLDERALSSMRFKKQ